MNVCCRRFFFATATALCVFLYRFRKYWSKTIFTESTYLMSFSLALAIQVTEILKEVKPSRLSIIVLLMLSPSSGSWFPSFSTHALSVNTVTKKKFEDFGRGPKTAVAGSPVHIGPSPGIHQMQFWGWIYYSYELNFIMNYFIMYLWITQLWIKFYARSAYKCGPFLHNAMLHVARSACWAHGWSVQKRMNRSICR